MARKGRSYRDTFGVIHHYDEHGKKIGRSDPSFFGSYVNYDKYGQKTGSSMPGPFGTYHHYNKNNQKTGTSYPGAFNDYHHQDSDGNSTGSSGPGMLGSYEHHNNEGCYVATCVYGSYDCPQVWTLRRFRDSILAETKAGRAFIRLYYTLSPAIVRRFGDISLFKRICRRILDTMVRCLNRRGISNTPYNDRNRKR